MRHCQSLIWPDLEQVSFFFCLVVAFLPIQTDFSLIVTIVFLLYIASNSEERNIIEAASNGASTAISLTLNIAANLIAFLGLLALFNALLGYFGGLVGIEGLSFEVSII